MIETDRQPWIKGLPVLGIIWLVGAGVDRLWFAIDRSMPAWDQADYLAAALTYWKALQTPQWLSGDWWTSFWQLSSKIPPLVFISTTPLLSWFGAGADQSTLINLLFSALLLGAVYGLGTYLFNVQGGLWAAIVCLLMPELYGVRLDYLIDYPLAAIVTLTFALLTFWRGRGELEQQSRSKNLLRQWILAIGVGLSFGLALMTKQTALLFLFVPLVWVGVESLWRRAWGRLAQLVVAMALTFAVCYPWYRANWLLILTASKRATIDSAIAENDPSLLSLDAWTYYLKSLPVMVSLPLLVVPLVGFLLFWRRSRVSSQWQGEADYAAKSKDYRQQVYLASRRSLIWLLGFWLGGYLLSSLNINKDDRYVVPYLPILAIVLAYGLTLLPKWLAGLKWGAIGLALALMGFSLSPLSAKTANFAPDLVSRHPADVSSNFPHAEVAAEVAKADPYLRSTIGVLPSTAEVNQHNINYYGVLHNFQVHGRQVGTQTSQIERDQQSLSWYLTKSGNQGSLRQPEAQMLMSQAIEQSPAFNLQKSWPLPDGDTLKLFRLRVPLQEISPLVGVVKRDRVQLDQVFVPAQAASGHPVPVTYQWSGSWKAMQSGLLLLTWKQAASPSQRWLHDHSIAMGYLRFDPPKDPTQPFQAIERMAMLPTAYTAPGIYSLEATYLDRQTGETYPIAMPPVKITIDPAVQSTAPETQIETPELDWLTQLRLLALRLPQGLEGFDRITEEVARINQYAPGQDYADQARQSMEYRLKQEPKNLQFAYTLALSSILKKRVDPAIVALQQTIQLDAQNPYPYAYLAFVNLYDFRPGAAQTAINSALALKPKLPELQVLKGVAALMQGNLVEAWRSIQQYRALSSGK